MAQLPVLKDWRSLLEKQLSKAAYTEADILGLLHTCQDYVGEIQPISQWIGGQLGFISQMAANFSNVYVTMYDKQPPPRPTEEPIKEVLLDTPEARKRAIREAALAIAQPGGEVSDESVLGELQRRSFKIIATNPTAAISTVLVGFKTDFDKVQGKRGIFRPMSRRIFAPRWLAGDMMRSKKKTSMNGSTQSRYKKIGPVIGRVARTCNNPKSRRKIGQEK